MVLMEFSVTPLGVGESVSAYVARCVEIAEGSGLEYELHSMGTIVEGNLNQVLDVLARSLEAVAADCGRVSCSVKLDMRSGRSGAIKSKVASVEAKLGDKWKQRSGG